MRVQRSRRWVDNQVIVRLRRQERLLSDDKPLRFHTIIAESAFAQADHAQLARIHERAVLPNVEVQVLINEVGLHDGHMGHFALLDFPHVRDSRVLYLEHAIGSLHVEDPEKVKASRLVYSNLSKIALTPEESATWIERRISER